MDHIFTPINDNISDAGDLVSAEAFQTLAENVNYLIDSMPVGSIIPIMSGFTGVPTPDPTIWHICDGSLITNPDSPLRDQNAPNYESDDGRYMRMYNTVGEIGNLGGQNNFDFTHDHSGYTDYETPDEESGDSDNDEIAPYQHRHSMVSDLSVTNMEPAHFVVKHYIKIR